MKLYIRILFKMIINLKYQGKILLKSFHEDPKKNVRARRENFIINMLKCKNKEKIIKRAKIKN